MRNDKRPNKHRNLASKSSRFQIFPSDDSADLFHSSYFTLPLQEVLFICYVQTISKQLISNVFFQVVVATTSIVLVSFERLHIQLRKILSSRKEQFKIPKIREAAKASESFCNLGILCAHEADRILPDFYPSRPPF